LNTDTIFNIGRTSLVWIKKQRRFVAVITLGLACSILPSVAFAQNNSTDPDPDVEKGAYLSLTLDQSVVAVGDPLTGTATVYEGDGDIDSDDTVAADLLASASPPMSSPSAAGGASPMSSPTPMSSQSAAGTVKFSFPTSAPGDFTIDGVTADVPDQTTAGHAIGGPITGDVSDVRYYADGSAPTKSLNAAPSQPSGTAYSWTTTSNAPGSGKVAFQGSTTSSTATIKGTAPSGLSNDVTVTLNYSLNGVSVPASQQLTVRTPTFVVENKTTPATEFHFGDINNPFDKAYGYSFGGGFNPGHDQQTLWALQDQFSLGMDGCTVGETWNFAQQSADNHSVYPTPDGKWTVKQASTWGTLAGGVFNDTDHFAVFQNGRDSADPNNFHFLADFNKTHDIGSATHEFHAYTPDQAGPILIPTYLTTYYADHAAWTASY